MALSTTNKLVAIATAFLNLASPDSLLTCAQGAKKEAGALTGLRVVQEFQQKSVCVDRLKEWAACLWVKYLMLISSVELRTYNSSVGPNFTNKLGSKMANGISYT